MERFEQVIEDYQRHMANGATCDEIITNLHARGISIIESMKVIRVLYNVNLRDAKRIVTAHAVWATLVHHWDPIHEALIEAMEKESRER